MAADADKKNLLLFTDGTGNAGGKTRNTNVYRLFQAIDRTSTEVEQKTFYDDGVGTSDNMIARGLGGALGVGLSRNIRQLYEWLIVNYSPGDRIFIFGFSRGAFTARCLAGLIRRCGILKREVFRSLPAKERRKRLRHVVWAYRALSDERFTKWRGPNEDFHQARTHFVGVWDTVDAVGMPVDELRPLMDRAVRLLCRRRAYAFDDMEIAGVEHARHAISIDDERRTFHPNVWHKNPLRSEEERLGFSDSAAPTDPAKIRQVWFAGAHSNVGGGYPQDQLACVTLDWMMGELEELEAIDGTRVRFIKGRREAFQQEASSSGRHYDPRTGLSVYYRYTPRRVTRFYKGTDDFWTRWRLWLRRQPSAVLPKHGIDVHASVFRRVVNGVQSYAPLFLPDPDDGDAFKLVAHYTHGESPFSRAAFAKKIENKAEQVTQAAREVRPTVSRLVTAKQTSYGVFLVATLIALFRGFTTSAPSCEGAMSMDQPVFASCGPIARAIKGMIPDLASRLVDAAFWAPGWALLYVVVIGTAAATSKWLGRKIQWTVRKRYESLG